MIVITKDSEKSLKRNLERFTEKSTNQRCLHLRFSLIKKMTKNWFFDLCAALEKVTDGHIVQVYLCADHDVMVLMPHLVEENLGRFLASFGTEETHGVLDKICNLYDVKSDLATLINICKEKIDLLDSEPKTDANKARSESSVLSDKLFSAIDPDFIMSLPTRRAQRRDIHIMIVDDDSLSRMMIKNVLMNDFNLIIAENAQEAILKYPQCAPDILFLDIGLPDIRGDHILERIIDIDPDAYIIMFSGRNDQDTILNALNAGAMGFVSKPFTRGKLIQYIDEAPMVQLKRGKNRNFPLKKNEG